MNFEKKNNIYKTIMVIIVTAIITFILTAGGMYGYYLRNDDGLLIASTPVSDDENWQHVEINKLFALIDGNVIFESNPHGNEFIFTPEHEKAMNEFLKSVTRDEIND